MNQPSRALTTAMAIILNYVLTGLFALLAAGALAGGITATQADNDGLFEGLGDAIGAVLIVASAVLSVLVGWGIAMGIGLQRRRRWARRSGIVTYALYGAFMAVNVAAQIGDADGQPGAAAVLMVVNLAVAALLLASPTRREFAESAVPDVGPYAQVLPPGEYPPPVN